MVAWATFPVASGALQTFTSVDTVDFLGILTIACIDISTTRDGKDNDAINGQPTPAVRIKVNRKLTLAGLPGSVIQANTSLNHAPSLGYMVKISTQGQEYPRGEWQNGDEQRLIEYALK